MDDLQQRYHWRGGWGSCRREGGGTEEPSSSLPWVCAIYQGSRPSARLVCWWIMKVSIDYDTHSYCSNWLGILQSHGYFVGGWWKLAGSMIRDAWCEHWMGSWEPKVCLMMASGTEQGLWWLVLDATIGHGSRGLKASMHSNWSFDVIIEWEHCKPIKQAGVVQVRQASRYKLEYGVLMRKYRRKVNRILMYQHWC